MLELGKGETIMFKIDEQFLESVGLGDMPEDDKARFLDYAQEELEVRVGERITDGMSEEKIEEFEKIIDDDPETIQKFLADFGDYEQDEVYKKLVESGFSEGSAELDNEYVSLRWLMENRPDFQDIVLKTVEELKSEIAANKDKI